MSVILYFLLIKTAKGIETSNLSNQVLQNFNNFKNELLDGPLFESEEEIKLYFKFCFPATTLKEMKDFKEICFNLIKKLEKIGILEQNSLIGKSILDSACGERLINFLRIFSDRVLILNVKSISQNDNLKFEEFYLNNLNLYTIFGMKNKEKIYPNENLCILTNNFEDSLFVDIKKKSIILNIVKTKDKILENSKHFFELHQKWKNYAVKITNELNNQEAENEEIYKILKGLKKNDKTIFSELSSLDRAPKFENYKFFFDQISKIKYDILESNEFLDNLNFIDEKESEKLFEY